jgi:hypothetical protein
MPMKRAGTLPSLEFPVMFYGLEPRSTPSQGGASLFHITLSLDER